MSRRKATFSARTIRTDSGLRYFWRLRCPVFRPVDKKVWFCRTGIKSETKEHCLVCVGVKRGVARMLKTNATWGNWLQVYCLQGVAVAPATPSWRGDRTGKVPDCNSGVARAREFESLPLHQMRYLFSFSNGKILGCGPGDAGLNPARPFFLRENDYHYHHGGERAGPRQGRRSRSD